MGAHRSVGAWRVDWLAAVLYGHVKFEHREAFCAIHALAQKSKDDWTAVPQHWGFDTLREIVPNGIIEVHRSGWRRQGRLFHRHVLKGEGWSIAVAEFEPYEENSFGNAIVEVTGSVEDVRGLFVALTEWLGDFRTVVNRLDVATDFTCPKVFQNFVDARMRGRWVSRARDGQLYFKGADVTGASWSSSTCRAVIYDKAEEQDCRDLTGDWYRLEFQLRGDMFKRAMNRTAPPAPELDDLFYEVFPEEKGSLWEMLRCGELNTETLAGLARYLVGGWLKLTVNVPDRASNNQSKAPIIPEWASFVDIPFGRSETVFVHKQKMGVNTALKLCAGLLSMASLLIDGSDMAPKQSVTLTGNAGNIRAIKALVLTGKMEGLSYERIDSRSQNHGLHGGQRGGASGLDPVHQHRRDTRPGLAGLGGDEVHHSDRPVRTSSQDWLPQVGQARRQGDCGQ